MVTRKKILIVEDEILTAMVIAEDLKAIGYNICKPVTTGEEAIKSVKNEKPDIILMDIRLAGHIDGIETAKHILEQTNVKIVFMSGYALDEIIERTKFMKAITFLSKPLQMMEMEKIIEKICIDL